MDNRSRIVYSPGAEAPAPEIEAAILATVYAFVLESYETKRAACVPEDLGGGET